MAITTIGQHMLPSFIPDVNNDALGLTSVTLNASGDRCAFVVTCPKSGTLDKFEFRTGAVANNPDNGIRLSFQALDTSTGMPNGTQSQYRDITGTLSANAWQVPGLMTSDGTDTGTKRTVTAGEQIGCVVDFVSFVASDTFTVAPLSLSVGSYVNGLNYVADASNGTYTKSTAAFPNLALKYDDGTYAAFPLFMGPVLTATNTAFSSSSTPDEIGVVFQVPISCRVVGAWARVDPNADLAFVLYDNSGIDVRTVTIDSDLSRSGHTANVAHFSSSYTLSANTNYRLIVKPTTTSNINFSNYTLPGSGYGTSHPMGATWVYTSRVNGGAFTDDNTKCCQMGLIVDGYDTGSGGGGTGGSYTFIG